MKVLEFFSILEKSIKTVFKNYYLFLPGIFLWAIIFLLSRISININQKLSNSIVSIIYIFIFFLVMLLVFSFFVSGSIAINFMAISGKKNFVEFFKSGKKFTIKSFFIFLLLLIIAMVIEIISGFFATFIGKSFGFNLLYAQITFFLIYFAFLISFQIFFTFSIFFIVIKNSGFFNSIKNSFKIVKKEYLATLTICIIFFLFLSIINRVNKILGDFLEYVIFIPIAMQFLTRFFLYAVGKSKGKMR